MHLSMPHRSYQIVCNQKTFHKHQHCKGILSLCGSVKQRRHMPTRVFGWIAVSLSLIYKFPQIYKLYTTHNTRGISVESQIVQASAYTFYIVHGLVISDPPVVFLGATSFAQSLVLIGQYFAYRNEPQVSIAYILWPETSIKSYLFSIPAFLNPQNLEDYEVNKLAVQTTESDGTDAGENSQGGSVPPR